MIKIMKILWASKSNNPKENNAIKKKILNDNT